MGSNRDSSAGVSIRDVALAWRSLGRDYGGDVTGELVLPHGSSTGVHIFVRVHYRPRRLGVRTIRSHICVSAAWPNGQSSTLAGLLYRLSFDLGSKLEAAPTADVASEQARLWLDE